MGKTISVYWTLSPNFGDALGPWLVERMTGKKVTYCDPSWGIEHYVVSGSILNHAKKSSIVWGAGVAGMCDGVDFDVKILSVRGPLSRAKALASNAICPSVYGDPAILLPEYLKPSSRAHALGIVPHYVDQYRTWGRYEGKAHIIDVLSPVEKFVQEVTSCERIISTSLHGLIVAHAYGIPALWMKFSDSILGDGTKYRDYFMSVGMDTSVPVDARDNDLDILKVSGFEFPASGVIEIMSRKLRKACPFL